MELADAVEFEVRGDGEAVLFIHGAIVADSFRPLMDEPALSDYRRIRYRRRGYGASLAPSSPPSIDEHVADALTLLRRLSADAAHVVGHSGGGPIALQLALDAPEVVRSLVLLEPAFMNGAMAAAFSDLMAPLVEMHRGGDSGKAVHLWMRPGAGSDWQTEFEKRLPGSTEQAVRDAGGTFDTDLPAWCAWDFDRAGASRLTQPVLYLVSAKSAAKVEPVTKMFLADVPHAELAVIADADHNMQVMKAAQVAKTIGQFLHRYPMPTAIRA